MGQLRHPSRRIVTLALRPHSSTLEFAGKMVQFVKQITSAAYKPDAALLGQLLLKIPKGSSVNDVDAVGYCALHQAVCRGDDPPNHEASRITFVAHPPPHTCRRRHRRRRRRRRRRRCRRRRVKLPFTLYTAHTRLFTSCLARAPPSICAVPTAKHR